METAHPLCNTQVERTQIRARKKAEEGTTEKASRSTARSTWWIAAFTIVLAIVAGLTLVEIIIGGADTKALVEASKKQACAASKSAQAARDFADTAVSINKGIGDAVMKLQIQAKGIENLTKQAVPISKASRDQSTIGEGNPIVTYDWAQLGHDRNSVFVDVAAKNIGPEAVIATALDLEIRKPSLKEQQSMKTYQPTSKVGGPGDSSLRKYLPLKGNPGLNSPNARVYFWGAIRYATQAGKPFDPILFCKSILAADILQKMTLPDTDAPPNDHREDYLYTGPFDNCSNSRPN